MSEPTFRASDTVIVPIHPAGYPFIAIGGLVSLFLLTQDGGTARLLGTLGLIVTAWIVYFFRDPKRVTPTRPGLVVAPGDGRVSQIVPAAKPPAELELAGENWTRVTIFLNVFDVHIQRLPIDGLVSKIVYKAGKFLSADLDKASEENERNSIVITGPEGKQFACVQIAGLVARRIVCDIKEGHVGKTGERYGLIRFGSRVDLFLPEGVAPLVIVGQRTLGGETIIADLASTEEARQGAVR